MNLNLKFKLLLFTLLVGIQWGCSHQKGFRIYSSDYGDPQKECKKNEYFCVLIVEPNKELGRKIKLELTNFLEEKGVEKIVVSVATNFLAAIYYYANYRELIDILVVNELLPDLEGKLLGPIVSYQNKTEGIKNPPMTIFLVENGKKVDKKKLIGFSEIFLKQEVENLLNYLKIKIEERLEERK